MPGGPSWLSTKITLTDAPNEPQLLRYHNPLECATYLFQNPSFKDHMDFSPKWVYKADGKTRLYHEMASAEGWHAEQVHNLVAYWSLWIDHYSGIILGKTPERSYAAVSCHCVR